MSLFKSLPAYLVIFSLLPASAWGSRLLSAQSSYHEKGRFALLVLHFDEKPAHRYQAEKDGSGAQITIANCSVDDQVAADLSAVRNALIHKVQMQTSDRAVTISLRFRETAKLVVRETENPYSLILDMAPLPKNSSKSQKELKPPPPVPSTKKTPQKKPLPPKNRDRLAESDTTLQPERFPGAQRAAQLAGAYDQTGNPAAEAKQWEAFFRAIEGSEPAADSLLAAQAAAPGEEKVVAQVSAQAGPTDTTASAATKPVLPAPAKTNTLLLYLLCGLSGLLGSVVIALYLRQRGLNRAVRALLEKAPESAASGPDETHVLRKPVINLPADEASPVKRPSEEVARQVLSLHKAGLPIAAIAEKLNMGQDEVKLVLNLAREVKETVE